MRIIVSAAILLTMSACGPQTANHEQKNRAAQQTTMERATAAVPVPHVSNFNARHNLAEYMRRMDDPSKVWYVYVLSDVGTIIGYHVGTYPQSVCTFMTPPEQLIYRRERTGVAVGTAPALDGVYYSGGGCSTNFMFDDNSDAMIFLGDVKFLAYDVPLDVEVEEFKLVSETERE